MTTFWVTHRTIVYEKSAQEVLDQFTDPHDRFHDQIMGVEWLLSRTPNIGFPARKEVPAEYLLLVLNGDSLANTKNIWLLYSYDDETVAVHGLNVTDVE